MTKILTTNNETDPLDPNGRVRGKTEGAEGDYIPIRRTTISTNQIPQCSQGLNNQPKSICG